MNFEKSDDMKTEKLPFEEALSKVGCGIYGFLLTCLTSVTLIGYASIAYNSMYVVPTSACELGTTSSQQGILAAGPVFGMLIGGNMWSYQADTRGRRSMLLIALIGSAILNLIGTISVHWIMLLIFQFVAAILGPSISDTGCRLIFLTCLLPVKASDKLVEALPKCRSMHSVSEMEGPLKKLATRASETLGSNSNGRRPLDLNKSNESPTGRKSLNQFVKLHHDLSVDQSSKTLSKIQNVYLKLLASGLFTISTTLLSECVPKTHRNTAVLIVFSMLFLAQGLLAMMALPIIPLKFSYYIPGLGIYWNSWRTLMAVFSLPNITSGICLYFMQESPKFIFTRGNEEKALEVLKAIYRINHWRSKDDFQVKSLLKDEVKATFGAMTAKERIIPLFKAPLLKYTIIMTFLNLAQQLGAFYVWLPKIVDQFMRSIQAGEGNNLTVCNVLNLPSVPTDSNATPCALNETSLLIVLCIGVLQSIFNLFISFLVNVMGRRNVTITVFSLCGTSGILVNLIPNMIGSVVLFIMMVMGVVVVGLSTAICVALFPTNLRAIAVEFTMFAQYIGSIASIQILNLLLNYHCDMGFYLFGSLLIASATTACFLPDDRRPQVIKVEPSEAAISSTKT